MHAVIEERRVMYNFLSKIYRIEVDKDFLEQLSSIDWKQMAESGTEDMQSACLKMGAYLKNKNINTLLDIARDFMRCFFGAGLPRGTGAYPYESVYTSPERLKSQEALDMVVEIYAEEGLTKAVSYTEPADHLSIELEFMSYLCSKVLEALKSDNCNLGSYLEKQKDFLEKHLMNWVPRFCEDLKRVAEHDFYKAAAGITLEFLKEDIKLLSELCEEAQV